MRRAKQYRRAALLLCIALVAGCSNDRLPTYPVQGRVVFPDGSPVRTGSIELKSREHGVQSRGNIASDGSFQLTTYDENDGAVEGTHQCVVVQLVMVEELDNFKPSTEGIVDPRFGSYSTSDLECRVSSAEENKMTVTVESLKPQRASGDDPPPSDHGHSHDHKHEHEAKAE